LEALYSGRTDDFVQDLAEHYAKSADVGKALGYLERAGDRDFTLFAYDEAGSYYGRALELVLADDAPGRARLLGKRGDAAYARGALAEARAQWAAALDVVDTACGRRLTADPHRRGGLAGWDGRGAGRARAT